MTLNWKLPKAPGVPDQYRRTSTPSPRNVYSVNLMLIVSTSTEELQSQLVELGAVAQHRFPKWEPEVDSIVAVVEAHPADVHLALNLDCETNDVESLWYERIRPFEANLRLQKRAHRRLQPLISPPDATWTQQAERLIARLMSAIGTSALRIDHIGSTAVAGLPAKNLIDIQVVVDDLAMALNLAEMSRRAGFVRVAGEWYGESRDGTKFREEVSVDADPGRSANVNFRPQADPVWNEALMFRDFLRAHSTERDRYADMKRLLVTRSRDVDHYSELKMPYITEALKRAKTTPL